jgi:CheY-like chemotaxis protein
MLEQFGAVVTAVATGAAATREITAAATAWRPYDIIFSAREFPDMNWRAIIETVGAKIDRQTVVLMTSLHGWNEMETEARQIGITRFLIKPLFPAPLREMLVELLEVSSMSARRLAAKKLSAPDAALDLSGKHLLLAEDIELNRLILIELLRETNVEIDEAEDGAIAVQKFAAAPEGYYDFILMDIQMPNKDGYTATREIRALPRSDAKTVPIIAVSANSLAENVEKSLACGMNAHLAKPVDIAMIKRVMSESMR